MVETLALSDIQKMQFADRPSAERALLDLLKRRGDLDVAAVELRPKAESLNSINGFVSLRNGDRFFFKAHSEENEQLSEYYNASILADAGYPVVMPKKIEHRPGQQIVLYDIIEFPTLFDSLKREEDAELIGNPRSAAAKMLIAAQNELDRRTAQIYRDTLRKISPEEHSRAPVHQLFSHRLAENGRVGLFYGDDKILDLADQPVTFGQLKNLRWKINGVEYGDSLSTIIDRSRKILRPAGCDAAIGHGDAHNGNIFVDGENEQLLMFDPAFAGAHDPILDLTKPLFHNVFARWMYYPEQVANEITVETRISGSTIEVKHNFHPSDLRLQFLRSRKTNVLRPSVEMLTGSGAPVAHDWRSYLRSSLFCCPFLTINLLASPGAGGSLAERYPLSIKVLALSMAVELGSLSHTNANPFSDLIDDLLEVA